MTRIGIFNLEMSLLGGGERRSLALAAHLSQQHEVIFITTTPLNNDYLEKFFAFDLTKVKFHLLNSHEKAHSNLEHILKPWSRIHFDLKLLDLSYQIDKLKLDILINNTYQNNLPCPARFGIYMCMFPHHPPKINRQGLIRNFYNSIIDHVERQIFKTTIESPINTYQIVTANSQFTNKWIKHYWQRDAEVVYSACELIPPGKKDKIILNIGRFIHNNATNNHKQQDLLINIFSTLTKAHKIGWQLHLAGNSAKNSADNQYVEHLKKISQKLPVFFHFNMPRKQLHKLYAQSSIYWHATGYGSNKEEFPSKQEHFGMTTVEAMSAGAVPVVINRGGQPEIVQHDIDGFLWDEPAALAEYTLQLVEDGPLRNAMAERAISNSQRFHQSHFFHKMDRIIENLVTMM